MTKKVITPASGSAQTIYYEANDDNTTVKFYAGGRYVTSHSKTDSFGRKVFDELQLGTDFVSRQFVYHAGKVTTEHKEKAKVKSSATTQLVSQIILSNGTTLSYGYDAEERITSVVETYTVDETPVTNTTLYTYDALGQLLTETVNGEVVNTMKYDNYGNIVEKNGKAYTYGNATWKDLLTEFDGKTIEYDAQSNPVKYLGHTLTWEKGRQLKSFDGNTYTYNANGIRTSKTINGVKHEYALDGTKILRETWDGNTLVPLYDNEDGVCGILYNSVPYYFIKNLQGDVIAIVDKEAQTVARYSYDAWGAITNAVTYTELTNDVDIATINPFRYRSCYYDEEINLYYLQSRYYDACVGRFICSDEASIFNNTSNTASISINKFSYCLNNPINNADDCGNIASAIIKMISNFIFGMLGGMLGLYLANVTLNLANGKKDFYAKNDSWGTYIAEGVKSGAFSIFGSKYLIKLGAVLAASVIKQFVDMIIYKSSFSWKTLFWDLLIGGLVVTAFHFGPTVISKLPKKQKNNSNKWLSKVKDLIKKIAERIISTLQKKLEKLISFFKNTFVKRFSISYAKRIGSELKKIFS